MGVECNKDGQISTNCIEGKIARLETTNPEKTLAAGSKAQELEMLSSEDVTGDLVGNDPAEETVLGEILAKKGLVPVRDPQTGDITGYTKVTK